MLVTVLFELALVFVDDEAALAIFVKDRVRNSAIINMKLYKN